MYPPSDEPEHVRIARNQAQAKWISPAVWLLLGMLKLFFGAAPQSGIIFISFALISVTEIALEKKAVAQKWRICFQVIGFGLLLIWFFAFSNLKW
jgi:hypothetical protein